MRIPLALLLNYLAASVLLAGFAHAENEPSKLAKKDEHALSVGRAVLRLDQLGGAGAPLMTAAQQSELERNVKFLSGTEAGRMTWAWLEFRLRADRQLQLKGNPHADAIRMRLKLFEKLVRKYFVLE